MKRKSIRYAERFIAIVLVLSLAAACTPAAAPGTPSLILATNTPAGAAPAATATSAPASAATATSAPAAGATSGALMQWPAPPPMTLDPDTIYLARFRTAIGVIVVELLADKAPVTVNNFVFLARAGYYDNTTFHRVLVDFMAQGGDPTGTGSGGPGYQFEDEFHSDLTFDEPGVLAMANSGAHTNGSQFFITTAPTPHLTFRHTIFGRVVEGFEVVQTLRLRDPNENPVFRGDTLMTIEIEEVAESLLPPPTATPELVVPVPEEGRPLADIPFDQRGDLFTGPPAMVIDTAGLYEATIATTRGDIVVSLLAADAPASVNNFVVLAELGYWDNFPVMYVEPSEFLLTGSPAGNPESDIGYTVPSEIKLPNFAGAVGLWYRETRLASSGSQVYILLNDNPVMDGAFTVFGLVKEGLDVAAQLTTEDVIESITISGP